MASPDSTIPQKRPVARQACNRCHAAKLRCIQSPRNQQCARCIKAGAECVHDPPQKLGRPRVHNLPPPDTNSPPPTQKQDTNFNTSLIDDSCWSTQDLNLVHTTGTSPRSSVNADTEDATTGSKKDVNSKGQNPPHLELEFLAVPQSHSTELEFDIDLYQTGDQPMQTDDSCFFTDLLTPGHNLDSPLTPPLSMESAGVCHDYRSSGYSNPPAPPTSSSNSAPLPSLADERSYSSISPQECPPENLVLVLSQLTAKLTKVHRQLTGNKQTQSHLSPGQEMGQLSISDDCFRAQLRANIEASEQILETLGCINDQSRIDTPDLAGSRQPDTSNLFERGRPRRPSTFTHRQRDGQSFSGPYSTMGNDQNYPDSPPTDPQDSIITMLVISIYLRLLHNFDILVSIMYMRLTEFGPTTRNSQSSTSGLEVPKNEPGPSYNPALHVSMGNCSFSSPSTASLQVLFNVQLINTFLAKVKISIQRMVSRQKISEAFGMGHDLFNSAFSNGHQHSASSAGVPGLHYHYHGIRHETPPSSSHGAPRPDEGVFAAGIYRAVRGVLGEIDHMESSLQGRADSIQQWTIEKT